MSENSKYNLPLGSFRHDAARQLSEKVANRDAAASLKINIDIDKILMKRDPRVAEVMLELLAHQVPFMLYTDAQNYAIIDPKRRMVAVYAKGRFNNRGFAQTDQQFANSVRLTYVCHEKIYVPSMKLGTAEGYFQGKNFVIESLGKIEKAS